MSDRSSVFSASTVEANAVPQGPALQNFAAQPEDAAQPHNPIPDQSHNGNVVPNVWDDWGQDDEGDVSIEVDQSHWWYDDRVYDPVVLPDQSDWHTAGDNYAEQGPCDSTTD